MFAIAMSQLRGNTFTGEWSMSGGADNPYLIRISPEMSIVTNVRIGEDGRPPLCPYGDPACPCLDGALCHYEDDPVGGTPAWPDPRRPR